MASPRGACPFICLAFGRELGDRAYHYDKESMSSIRGTKRAAFISSTRRET